MSDLYNEYIEKKKFGELEWFNCEQAAGGGELISGEMKDFIWSLLLIMWSDNLTEGETVLLSQLLIL